jgi:RNA polymerase primary sigma factor
MIRPMRRVDEATDSLQAYLRAIAKLPRVTPADERELGRRIQESAARGTIDEEALRRLVEANLRFVVSYAKRYRAFGVPFLDLIHEGNLGLIEAARRFDPSHNVKFITYAVWWIRQAILSALTDQTRAVSTAPVSLDAPVAAAGDDAPELWEQIEQCTEPPAEAQIVRRALRDQIQAALRDLDAKEREVVALRFGLGPGAGDPRTLQEIGDRLHLSRERVRQIESRAKEKLRRSQRVSGLRSFLN